MRCYAYSYAYDFDLKQLTQFLAHEYEVTSFRGVRHIRLACSGIVKGEGDVFIFPYGAVVFWGLTESHEAEFIEKLTFYQSSLMGDVDDDLYSFSYDTINSLVDDHLTLVNPDILNKLACSHGLAQSVKLGGFEQTIQKIIELTKELPNQLASHGTISLSKTEIRKLMGRIFIDRSSINLHLEFLDTPDFFWDHTELEPLHDMIVEYMSQSRRVSILNQRLRVIQELIDMLASELNSQHSSKLEWIIIILIFVEVSVMFAKEIFHLV